MSDAQVNSGSIRSRVITIAGAVLATGVVWLIGHHAFGVAVEATTGSGTQTVGLLSVVIATVVTGLAGWGLLVLLERWTARPGRVFVIVGVLVLLLSLGGALSGRTVGAKAVLLGLHLVAALTIVPGLARTAGQRAGAGPVAGEPAQGPR